MKDAQEQVDEYIQEHGGYWEPMSQVLRLVEEVGEFSREINHRYGAKRKKATEEHHRLEDEFGDLLFVVIATANSLKIDLDEALTSVIEKYKIRDKGRWTSESESERQS